MFSFILLAETLDPVNILLAVGFFGILVAVLVFKSQTNSSTLDKYLAENRIDAEVQKTYFLPFRFWFKNRKGDHWRKLAYPNGAVKYARVRNRLTGTTVDIFDYSGAGKHQKSQTSKKPAAAPATQQVATRPPEYVQVACPSCKTTLKFKRPSKPSVSIQCTKCAHAFVINVPSPVAKTDADSSVAKNAPTKCQPRKSAPTVANRARSKSLVFAGGGVLAASIMGGLAYFALRSDSKPTTLADSTTQLMSAKDKVKDLQESTPKSHTPPSPVIPRHPVVPDPVLPSQKNTQANDVANSTRTLEPKTEFKGGATSARSNRFSQGRNRFPNNARSGRLSDSRASTSARAKEFDPSTSVTIKMSNSQGIDWRDEWKKFRSLEATRRTYSVANSQFTGKIAYAGPLDDVVKLIDFANVKSVDKEARTIFLEPIAQP